MKHASRLAIASVVVLVAFVPALAADKVERIREGVRLHDQQDFDGAMAVYREVLKDYPHDASAVYEMAYSWVSSGKDLEGLTRFIDAEVASGVEQSAQLFWILGWAHDALGNYPQGEVAFRRAIERLPDQALSHYNLAVNLDLQRRHAEALDAFLESARRNPGHASTWHGLAAQAKELNRPQRALFATARAVALEPGSPRGRQAAGELWGLMFSGVNHEVSTDATKPPQSKISITIPAPSDKPGEPSAEAGKDDDAGDPAILEPMMASIAASLRYTEPWKDKSNAEFFAYSLDHLAVMFSGMEAIAGDPFWKVALPWFAKVREAGHAETVGYLLLDAAGDADAARWVQQNSQKVTAYREWR